MAGGMSRENGAWATPTAQDKGHQGPHWLGSKAATGVWVTVKAANAASRSRGWRSVLECGT